MIPRFYVDECEINRPTTRLVNEKTRNETKITHQSGLEHFGVHIGVFRHLHNLERDLNHASREISDRDEMSQSRLQDSLQLALGRSYKAAINVSRTNENPRRCDINSPPTPAAGRTFTSTSASKGFSSRR